MFLLVDLSLNMHLLSWRIYNCTKKQESIINMCFKVNISSLCFAALSVSCETRGLPHKSPSNLLCFEFVSPCICLCLCLCLCICLCLCLCLCDPISSQSCALSNSLSRHPAIPHADKALLLVTRAWFIR